MHVIITCKYEKGLIKKQPRKCGNTVFSIITLSVAMATSRRILPNFKLIQALMYVIVTCKYQMDPRKSGNTLFYHYKFMGIFFRRSRAVGGPIWLNFELLPAPMHDINISKYKKIGLKQLRKSGNTIFSIITLWELSVAMETRVLVQSCPKPDAAFPPFY